MISWLGCLKKAKRWRRQVCCFKYIENLLLSLTLVTQELEVWQNDHKRVFWLHLIWLPFTKNQYICQIIKVESTLRVENRKLKTESCLISFCNWICGWNAISKEKHHLQKILTQKEMHIEALKKDLWYIWNCNWNWLFEFSFSFCLYAGSQCTWTCTSWRTSSSDSSKESIRGTILLFILIFFIKYTMSTFQVLKHGEQKEKEESDEEKEKEEKPLMSYDDLAKDMKFCELWFMNCILFLFNNVFFLLQELAKAKQQAKDEASYVTWYSIYISKSFCFFLLKPCILRPVLASASWRLLGYIKQMLWW